MARSNTGGTRGFLRGRVAADLYQVTKDVNGKRIQLVRSVEDGRINNNTIEQALARQRMALLMGALSDMKSIVDHSFEGIPYGQLSIAHFVKLNMPRVIQDQYENWASESNFLYPDKGISQMRLGNFLISTGSLTLSSSLYFDPDYSANNEVRFYLDCGIRNATMGDIKKALGLNVDDYITFLIQAAYYSERTGLVNCAFYFLRIYLTDYYNDDEVITSLKMNNAFRVESNTDFRLSSSGTNRYKNFWLRIDPDGLARSVYFQSIIVSKWNGKVWQRNNAEMLNVYGDTQVGHDDAAANWHFQSWYPTWDPDGEDAGEYPGKPPY